MAHVRHTVHTGWQRVALGACMVPLAALLSCAGQAPPDGAAEQGMLPARWTDSKGLSQEVPFTFEAENPVQGVMFTTLGKGGEHFRGPYVRLEASSEGQLVTEVYDGWSGPEWQAWQHEPDGDWIETAASYGDFAELYTGKVVATLPGGAGRSMRCRLTLKDPVAGLLHGGRGMCQVSDGGRVDLEF